MAHLLNDSDSSSKTFQPINDGEQVLFEGRKHWITLLITGIGLTMAAAFPLIVIVGVYAAVPQLFEGNLLLALMSLYCMWLLMLWVALFYSWTDYYLDIWIVTDQKLVDIDQSGFFRRKVSTLHLEKVQDATVSVKGLIPTWLDYGDVVVQSAGTEHEFIIKGVARPYDMKEAVMHATGKRNEHLTAKQAPRDTTSVNAF